MRNRIRILIVYSLIIFESCSVFKSTQKINIQPFSDNAAVLFNEAIKVSRPFQFKNLSTYTDVEEYQTIKEKSLPLIKALKGIVYYSNQIVVIYNSRLTDKQKNMQLRARQKHLLTEQQNSQQKLRWS